MNKQVFIHDDGGECAGTPLDENGKCPGCGLTPDMQSIALMEPATDGMALVAADAVWMLRKLRTLLFVMPVTNTIRVMIATINSIEDRHLALTGRGSK